MFSEIPRQSLNSKPQKAKANSPAKQPQIQFSTWPCRLQLTSIYFLDLIRLIFMATQNKKKLRQTENYFTVKRISHPDVYLFALRDVTSLTLVIMRPEVISGNFSSI